MKSIQKIKKELTEKVITKKTLTKLKGGTTLTIIVSDDLDG